MRIMKTLVHKLMKKRQKGRLRDKAEQVENVPNYKAIVGGGKSGNVSGREKGRLIV